MASKIVLKKSSIANKIPTVADLDYGELALNYADGKLYFKKADGSTVDSFTTASASGVTSIDGLTGAITATQILNTVKTVDGEGSGLDADTLDGNHASAFYLASNPNGYTSNTGTVTSVSGTAPIVSSGGTAPSISIPAATSTVNGYMTSTYAAKLDGIAAGATANTGTVTSVSGTGTVSGLTLSGTVTGSGNLTLGGTLSLTSAQVTTALGYTPYNSTNPNGYITSSASITGSAGSVAWGNVASRPGWLSGGSYIETQSDANSWVNSGFYENGGGGSNWPSATWYNSINVRHSNQGNYHGFQVAMSYYDNNLWFRSYQGSGTFQPWTYAISSTNNSSLNSDTRNTRGVTRLYRRDDNSDYSVQTYWTGSYWRLYGYNGDTGHADTHVGYSDNSGNSATTSQRTFARVRTDNINRGLYGSISISGTTNTYHGIDFTDNSHTWIGSVLDGVSFGVYQNNSSWAFYFDNSGTLQVGTVPWARVSGGPSGVTGTAVRDIVVNHGGSVGSIGVFQSDTATGYLADRAASSLYVSPSDQRGYAYGSRTQPSGTWRCLGYTPVSNLGSDGGTCVWCRIA